MNAPLYFWLMLKAALFSTNGTGNLPSLHADFLARGWATDRQFVESLAVGQITPGPNGLWVISFGYLTAGWWGAGLALAGSILPPVLVLAIDRVYRRYDQHPAMEGFVAGLSLAVVGVSVVVYLGLLRASGLSPATLAIVLVSMALVFTRRVPVIAVLAAAALAGVALYW